MLFYLQVHFSHSYKDNFILIIDSTLIVSFVYSTQTKLVSRLIGSRLILVTKKLPTQKLSVFVNAEKLSTSSLLEVHRAHPLIVGGFAAS